MLNLNPVKVEKWQEVPVLMPSLMSRDGKYAILKLPSGETRMVLVTCKATIGSASNPDHMHEVSGKAGRNRWLGRRPRTRPVAMNPVDHPMGGGEGRASGGHPRSRKGIPAKGYKTRSRKKSFQADLLLKEGRNNSIN
jgi:large subunit ribosomal protein L2